MNDGLLYVSYQDTLDLFTAADALRIVEDVYRMHADGSVVFANPPAFKMDVTELSNHWHVKGCLLKDIPIAGVRMYSYFDDGRRSTVGTLDSTRFVVLSDPRTSKPVAIVDEHWTFALRSTAAAVAACKWMTNPDPKVLGLVGVGTMGKTALDCLMTMYRFDEVRCTSRRPETRAAFAREYGRRYGLNVFGKESIEEVVRGADVIVGGTTSTEIVSREPWVKPGATFLSLARRELDPAGWAKMDKVVVDSFDLNMLVPVFRDMVEAGQFSRQQLHAEIWELVAGKKKGRERREERTLIHTTGLVSQDVAIAHWVYQRARALGRGVWLPAAHLAMAAA
jgi:ornithine cyclodeaminase